MVTPPDDPLGTTTGWIEVELALDPRLADEASALLFAHGATGAEELLPEEGRARLRAWFPVTVEPQSAEIWLSDLYRSAAQVHADLKPVRVRISSVEEKDWAESWKSCFAPLRVGRLLRILPSWLDAGDTGRDPSLSPDARIVRLDPGMAFGTGTHPTTFMCLEHLEQLARDRRCELGRVWDWGTGSGILAIAAAKLGGAPVLGTDTSAQAIQAAQDNARLNDAGNAAEFVHRPVYRIKGPFDLILANLYAEVLLKDGPDALKRLAPGGTFIASGFVAERATEIEKMLASAGLMEVARTSRRDSVQTDTEEWVSLRWIRP